jgi:DNA-binding response OmpR family regulator
MLPDIRPLNLFGIEVFERLRLHQLNLPVTMLTALDAVRERVRLRRKEENPSVLPHLSASSPILQAIRKSV